MSALFSPLTLREVTFRNRIFVSPMCMYSSEDGMPTPWHLVHLGSRAVGGAGLVMAEATAVVPEGRISPADSGLWSPAHAAAFVPITEFIHAQGSVAAIQLAHAGRKASTRTSWDPAGPGTPIAPDEPGGWQTVAPSAVPFRDGQPVPHALTAAELDDVVAHFVRGTRFALDAGFRVIELHMAHGYLLNEFLSPLSNRRDDAYGGDFAGRTRLPLRVTAAVRAAWPAELPLFVRISATDWADGGWTIDDSVAFARLLKEHGVDLVDCSSGGLVPWAKIEAGPGYQVPFARAVREGAAIATGAVGLITEAAQAEAIIAGGAADAVLLARKLLADPYWPLHAAAELGVDAAWPRQYGRGKPAPMVRKAPIDTK
jgi:2,4-dienoyl-CoA reductase-like NADH-dependent reductase (Old Yellow Enzyme family)